jgi:hypothetical protein
LSKSRKFSPLSLTRQRSVCEKSIRKVCSAKTGLYTIDFYDLVKGSVAAPPSGGSGLKLTKTFSSSSSVRLQLLPQGGVD